MRRMMESEVTLFPQPDSPTNPTVRPLGMVKLISSTAVTSLESVLKQVFRLSTFRSGSCKKNPYGKKLTLKKILRDSASNTSSAKIRQTLKFSIRQHRKLAFDGINQIYLVFDIRILADRKHGLAVKLLF